MIEEFKEKIDSRIQELKNLKSEIEPKIEELETFKEMFLKDYKVSEVEEKPLSFEGLKNYLDGLDEKEVSVKDYDNKKEELKDKVYAKSLYGKFHEVSKSRNRKMWQPFEDKKLKSEYLQDYVGLGRSFKDVRDFIRTFAKENFRTYNGVKQRLSKLVDLRKRDKYELVRKFNLSR